MFKSRVHLALRYKKIERDAAQKIWHNILANVGKDNERTDKKVKVEFSDDEVVKWALKNSDSLNQRNDDRQALSMWDGRQIPNAFQSTIVLASFDGVQTIEKRKLTEKTALIREVLRSIKLTRKHFDHISTLIISPKW